MGTSLTLSAMCGSRGRFRRYDRFRSEWTSAAPLPNVIFIEPEYTDGPHETPNDDHPPTDVGPGQALLLDLYTILISNPERWAKTLLIITYDEHGGFFDHMPPLPMETAIAGQLIPTTGVRVPAFLISPWVQPGTVFKGPLDHTSILQFLADRFGKGSGYSVPVDRRQSALDRISNALKGGPAAPTPAPPRAVTPIRLEPGTVAAPVPNFATPNAAALDSSARKFVNDHRDLVEEPAWASLRKYVETVPRLTVV